MKTKNIKAQALGLFLTLSLAPVPLFADIGGSVAIPTGGGSVQTNPPDEKVQAVPKAEVQANRASRKATAEKATGIKDKNTCISTSKGTTSLNGQAVATNTCKEGATRPNQPSVPAAQESQIPVNPSVDVNSVGGR